MNPENRPNAPAAADQAARGATWREAVAAVRYRLAAAEKELERERSRAVELRQNLDAEQGYVERLERELRELRSAGERRSGGAALAPDRLFRREDSAPVCSPFRGAEVEGELLEAEPPHDAELAAFGYVAEQVLLAGVGRARFERTATAGDRTVTDALELEATGPPVKAPAELEGRVEERLRALGAPLGDATREELLGLRAEHERIVPMLGAAKELEGGADDGDVADRVEALIFERLGPIDGVLGGRRTWRTSTEQARERVEELEREFEELRKRSSAGDARPTGAALERGEGGA